MNPTTENTAALTKQASISPLYDEVDRQTAALDHQSSLLQTLYNRLKPVLLERDSSIPADDATDKPRSPLGSSISYNTNRINTANEVLQGIIDALES